MDLISTVIFWIWHSIFSTCNVPYKIILKHYQWSYTYIYNWQQQKYIKFYVLFYFPIQELALISQHLAIINIKLIHWTLSNLFQNALVITILQGFQWGDMHCAVYRFFSPLPIIKSCSHLNEFKFLSMAKYM